MSVLGLRPTRPVALLRGELRLPADKSVAHRALIANALAGGPAEVRLRAPGDDLRSTVACLRVLGVGVDEAGSGDEVTFSLSGVPGTPGAALDCGNSGTTMRLLAGALAGLGLGATLDGDPSLRRRPMERLARPLRAMGAAVETTDGHAPLRLSAGQPLRAMEHRLPVPSAQLVGAVALAALAAEGETRIVVPGPTRDHTERLLAWMGVDIARRGRTTVVRGPARPGPRSLTVAGDASAASAWMVAGAIHPDADLHLAGVGLNPTRLGALEVLREMGAAIDVAERSVDGPEPVGDVRVRSAARLRPIALGGERVAELIDELPALAVAMAAAGGTSELRDAGELRVKESDRIAAVVAGLAAIGARVEELPDGWRVAPGEPRDAAIATHADHRIAIAFAIAGLAGVAREVRLDDPACASVSYPTFWDDLARVSGAGA
ncbi:MAG: 3-phosphoshikimate 1-carboxyvinyltransferase [Candidatus Limnocylindria bacterium]